MNIPKLLLQGFKRLQLKIPKERWPCNEALRCLINPTMINFASNDNYAVITGGI